MKKITSLTIGIPAYNEEKNIESLILDILKQKGRSWKLDQVIVSSDGSSDKTNQIVKKYANKGVKLFANIDRKGISRGLNQIVKSAKSDVLIILNADIRIVDPNCFEILVKEILSGADLVSAPIEDKHPRSLLAKSLVHSMKLKEIVFTHIKHGRNPYTCHGPVRAFSKRFYKKLSFPVSVGEDMYSYFACIKLGFVYSYTQGTEVIYKVPETFKDHEKQSRRFFQNPENLAKHISKNLLDKELSISQKELINGLFHSIPSTVKHPIETCMYACVLVVSQIRAKSQRKEKETWGLSQSSKAKISI